MPTKQSTRVVLPMVAHPFDDAHQKHLHYPCYVQPKLDGVRMMAALSNDSTDVSLYSRTGKPFSHLLQRFRQALLDLRLPPGTVLDGELYLHGVGFQPIVSMAKNKSTVATHCKLQYHVYDVVLDVGYEDRLQFLSSIQIAGNRVVVLVDTVVATNLTDVKRLLANFEKQGYEGIMLRDRNGPYATGKRSNTLLKLKSFQDAEFLIVGVEEAGGKDAGTAVFVCMATNGALFRVRPTGTMAERAKMLQRGPELIHSQSKLTVRFQELTEGGVPRFPVGVAIRDYE